MTLEQLERRLRLLEQSTKGSDYVRLQDEADTKEDTEKHDKSASTEE
jgi:hypothetical protein